MTQEEYLEEIKVSLQLAKIRTQLEKINATLERFLSEGVSVYQEQVEPLAVTLKKAGVKNIE